MTYNERVRAIAEEMAIEDYRTRFYPHTWDGGSLNDDQKEHHIKFWLPAARIAVKHMAEAVEHCALNWEGGLQDYLNEQGLIPDQEAGGNE